ncbi:MAG: EthD domain-containing protein [Halieaceae bacterium]|nr:EthD domain-containing protein [Halieaceae bacterium]
MEKILYPLWKPAAQDADAFRQALLELAPALEQAGARGLRLAVADTAVAAGEGLRQAKLCDACDGLLSVWLDSNIYRAPIEAVFADHCDHFHAYLVTESAPLVNQQPLGERMAGWTQVVFLERPSGMSEVDWLTVWQGSHTPVAIETQSNFAYRQNVVVRTLSEGAPVIHAIVEESFPEAALASPHAFYDARSDEDLQARLGKMIESCARFIDFERLNVSPMSEYLLRAI